MSDMDIRSIPKNWDSQVADLPAEVNSSPLPTVGFGEKPKKSFAFKFLIASFIILFLAGAYAGISYYMNKNSVSSEKIIIKNDVPEYVDSGKNILANISVENQNTVDLQDVHIKISYQKGINQNGETDIESFDIPVGVLGKNTMYSTTTAFVFFGEEGTRSSMSISMEYKVLGANAVFSKVINKEIKTSSAQVTLKIEGRDSVISDHDTNFNIKIKNIAQENFTPTSLSVVLPNNFIYKPDSTTTSTRNPVFKVADLKIGEVREFNVTGYFKDSVGLTKTVRVYASEDKGDTVGSSFASDQHEILVTDFPVKTKLIAKVLGAEVSSLSIGKEAKFVYSIMDNVDGSLDNITVKVDVSDGEVFNFDEENTKDLLRLTPGMETKLEFALKTIKQSGLKIKIEIYGKFKGEPNVILFKSEIFNLNAN